MRLCCAGITKPATPTRIKMGAKIASVIRLALFLLVGLLTRAVESRALIRFVKQFNGVADPKLQAGQAGSGRDLHMTSGVAGGQNGRRRLFDVPEFLFQHLP